jgi:hypothetical protein
MQITLIMNYVFSLLTPYKKTTRHDARLVTIKPSGYTGHKVVWENMMVAIAVLACFLGAFVVLNLIDFGRID